MKKTFAMLLVLGIILLAACGGNAENAPAEQSTPAEQPAAEAAVLADGVHIGVSDAFSSSGWKDYVAVTVQNGAITAVDWNGIPANGTSDKKTASKTGQYDMKVAGAQYDWYEQAASYEQAVINAQAVPDVTLNDEGKTDAISGVTIHVNEALELTALALTSEPSATGTYKDGAYLAMAEAPDSNGYTDYVAVYVYNGNIISVNWDALNSDGATKSSIGDEYGLRAASSIQKEWYEQAAAFDAYVVQNQGVNGIALNDSGKTDAVSGCTISISLPIALFNTAIENAK